MYQKYAARKPKRKKEPLSTKIRYASWAHGVLASKIRTRAAFYLPHYTALALLRFCLLFWQTR